MDEVSFWQMFWKKPELLFLYVGLCRFHSGIGAPSPRDIYRELSLFEHVMEQEDLHSLLVHLSNLSRVSIKIGLSCCLRNPALTHTNTQT